MKRHWLALLLAAAAIAGAATGCLFVAAGAATGGTIVYVKGELQETFAAPIDKVSQATEKALAQLQVATDSAAKDGLVGHYIAHLADGTKVVIELTSTGTGSTRVGVRVGLVGDRAQSQRLLSAIRESL